MLSKFEIFDLWVKVHGPLDQKQRTKFLAHPRLPYLEDAGDHLLKAAIGRHKKLDMIAKHIAWRRGGGGQASSRAVGPCGCRGQSKMKGKLPSNTFSYASERYGGPSYHSPPTGGIAGDW